MTFGFYTTKDICNILGITRPTLYAWMEAGRVPQPDVRPNPRINLWDADKFDAWLAGHGDDVLKYAGKK